MIDVYPIEVKDIDGDVYGMITGIMKSLTKDHVVFIGMLSSRRYIHVEPGKVPDVLDKMYDTITTYHNLSNPSTRHQQYPKWIEKWALDNNRKICLINIDMDFSGEPYLATCIRLIVDSFNSKSSLKSSDITHSISYFDSVTWDKNNSGIMYSSVEIIGISPGVESHQLEAHLESDYQNKILQTAYDVGSVLKIPIVVGWIGDIAACMYSSSDKSIIDGLSEESRYCQNTLMVEYI